MKHKSKKQRKAIRNRNSGTDEPRYKKGQKWREKKNRENEYDNEN